VLEVTMVRNALAALVVSLAIALGGIRLAASRSAAPVSSNDPPLRVQKSFPFTPDDRAFFESLSRVVEARTTYTKGRLGVFPQTNLSPNLATSTWDVAVATSEQ
jgi:hypothetical protein